MAEGGADEHCYTTQRDNMIRKQLKSGGSHEYKDELRCLRLLDLISHPNILTIFGSYTYRGKHNFLFPVAKLGDLHGLLSQRVPLSFLKNGSNKDPSAAPVLKEEAFYEAMCGLASALEQLHYYSNDDLKLDMIGCHHDLKPRNILVHEGKFILADFGLSTLDDKSEDPERLSQDRDRYFDSPESQDFMTMEKYPVGPPSDIWSLACITAVILAYMKGGPEGVESFKEERRYTFRAYRGCTLTIKNFHGGRGRDNPGALKWLVNAKTKAEEDGRQAEAHLVELIQDMLVITPSDRPEIREVLRRLRYVTLRRIAEPILEEFCTSRHRDTLEFAVERHILAEWLEHIGPIARSDPRMLRTDESFAQLRRALGDIGQELSLLSDIDENDRPLFSRLRHSNEILLSSVDPAVQRSIQRCVERELLQTEVKVVNEEGDPSKSSGPHDPEEPVGSKEASTASSPSFLMRVAITNMTKLMHESNSSIPKLSPDVVPLAPLQRKEGGVPTFRLAKLREESPDGDKPAVERDVIVEEMLYSRNVADEAVARTLFDRMQHVLGKQNSVAADFRALKCRGFYHVEGHHYFGLVYEYPETAAAATTATTGPSSPPARAVQLAELIHDLDVTDYKRSLLISLDDRFRLAYDLAAAVYAFHQVGWLHKNISSYNVLFFQDDDKKKKGDGSKQVTEAFSRLSLASPFLIGFSHARPNEEGQYSNKTSVSAHGDKLLRAYRHPFYYGDDERRAPYRTAYDYYSLGLVLLEIGYWRPLKDIVSTTKGLTHAERTDHLRSRRVPALAASMGDAYTAAVAACLDDAALNNGGASGDRGDQDAERLAVDRNFERLVVTPLEALAKGYQRGALPLGG